MYNRVTLSLVFIDLDSDSTPLSRKAESSKVVVQLFPSVLNVNLVVGKDEVIGFISDVACLVSMRLEFREELATVSATTDCALEVRVALKVACAVESTRKIGDITSSVASESETALNGAVEANFTVAVAVDGNSPFESDILFCGKGVILSSESSRKYVPEESGDI